jgi:aspartate/methionine/tyrosine aminotransferase
MHLETPHGAMYAFIKFELPYDPKVDVKKMNEIQQMEYEAKRDFDYCMALLEETGICVVPGSGFGQLPGTLHFRTTFLPPLEEIKEVVLKLRIFHEGYTKKLRSSY